MNNWDSSLIEKIFTEKQKEKSEDRDNLLKLTSQKLYGEKIHYALELIQNAEDENSPSITFMFNNDNVIIINDGESFDEKDVWRICSVRPGEKKKKIGFFGIGFKSVFNITKKPQIISGKFNFEIEKYIYPRALTFIPESVKEYYSPDNKGAIFILPYCSELSSPKELIENFNLIDEKILLFLESLKKINFADNINTNNWAIQKIPQSNFTVSLLNTLYDQETKWRVSHKDIPIEDEKIIPEGKEGVTETKITIAFPIDGATRDLIKKNGVVYCYLPTKERTDLPFLIQADFLPTIGREYISDHPWNIWLLKELGTLATDAIEKIKVDDYLGNFLYDFIPLSEEIHNELIKHLYNPLFKSLKEKEIAKSTKGWINPEKCAIPNDERIRNILTELDLEMIFGEKIYYIDPNLSEIDHFTRAKKVLFELGAKQIGEKEVVDFLQKESEIRNKTKEWFLNLYEYLSTIFDTSKKSYLEDFPWVWDDDTKLLFEKLTKTNFILTDDKRLVPLKDPAVPDRLICYPQSIDPSEVHQLFTEGEIVFLHRYFQESSIIHRKEDSVEIEERRKGVKEWLDSVGVKKYFKQVHIIKEVILPKFTTGKYKKYDDLKLYNLLDYIRIYWSTIESEIQNKKQSLDIIREIKNSVLIKTFSYKNGNKLDDYKRPEEIYFSKRYGKTETMEDLFDGIDGISFLSLYYLNREKREIKKKKRGRQKVEYTWKKFFEILGVWSCPRVLKEEKWISIRDIEKYNWVKKEYSTSGTHTIYGNSYSEDIERLIEFCSKMDNKSNIQKRMILLWESLEKNWKTYKEYCKTKYKWFYRSEQYKDYETSSFLEFLRNARWVIGEEEGFYKPSEVFTDTKINRLLLGDNARYVNLKANETFLKDAGVRIEPTIEEVIDHLKAYRERYPNIQKNKVEKMQEIYRFLMDKINTVEDPIDRNEKIKKLADIFNEHDLLYLPREDKVWWKPGYVFWEDSSPTFEKLRGYIEHQRKEIYNPTLKDFLLSLGVIEKPLVKESLDVLEEIKGKENLELFKRVAPKVYTFINETMKHGITQEVSWEKPVFLSESNQFLCPIDLYYNDNDEYKKYFEAKIEILWLPFSWVNIKDFLRVAGFKKLSQNISINKKFNNLSEIEGDTLTRLINRLSCVENYFRKKNVVLHEELQKGGTFNKVKKLQAYETPKIILDFLIKVGNSEPIIINDVEKEAYFSNEENRIYKSDQIVLFSPSVAKELSKLFAYAEDDVFPFLDSIFAAESDDKLNEKLQLFGLQTIDTLKEEYFEGIKLIQLEPTVGQHVSPKEEPISELQKEPSQKPQLPVSEPTTGKFDLIDPDTFVFDTIEEHTPYIKIDGMLTIATRTVKLKKGYPGTNLGVLKTRKSINRGDAEAVALEIVMRFEQIEDRIPDDRHKQPAIGYDIYSVSNDKKELFIEVKHFRDEAGTWEFTPHQWKKAEQEKDKYFVCIVSRLREGSNPTIEIIQNPVKCLTPDPPIQIKFSDWKNAVTKVIKCQRV